MIRMGNFLFQRCFFSTQQNLCFSWFDSVSEQLKSTQSKAKSLFTSSTTSNSTPTTPTTKRSQSVDSSRKPPQTAPAKVLKRPSTVSSPPLSPIETVDMRPSGTVNAYGSCVD